MARKNGRNFDPEAFFFVLDSEHLDRVQTRLDGYCYADGAVADSPEALAGRTPEKEGAYVYVLREGNRITIRQDFMGSFGLYLYREGDFFALSDSFLLLAEHLRTTRMLTLNREFADYLLSCDMCSSAYGETLIREITVLDRSAIAEIDINRKTLEIRCEDFLENTVEPDTPEGLAILDAWRNKWAGRIRNLTAASTNIRTDLSGGFDSRATLTLFLSAGVDMSRVMVYSRTDSQKTHTEDYRIASQLAERLGFTLNDASGLARDSEPYSLEDILDICFYTKLGFHKQMYYTHSRLKERKYTFTGFGGGCIRELWDDSEEKTTARATARCSMFDGCPPEISAAMRISVENVMRRTFRAIREKYEAFQRQPEDAYLSEVLYRDTRGRNHFGKSQVVQYLANAITVSPLMDLDLYRLKLSSDRCPDTNLLYALLTERYVPGILETGFDSGRSIQPETIAYARETNRKYPFREDSASAEVPVFAPAGKEPFEALPFVPQGRPDEVVRNAFHSDAFRRLFESEYDASVYEAVAHDIATRKYYPMSVGYAAVAIGKALRDVQVSAALRTPFTDFLTQEGREPPAEKQDKPDNREPAVQTAPPAGLLRRAARKLRSELWRTAP